MLFSDIPLIHVLELTGTIWSATRGHLEAHLRPLSMTWPQFGMLLALDKSDGSTQRELGELIECDRTTTSVICDSLERHGWAERRADPADRRAKRVFLTQAGRDALSAARERIWYVYGSVENVLSAEECAAVIPLLERVHAVLRSVAKDGAQAEADAVDGGRE